MFSTKKEHIHVVREDEAEEKGIEPGLYKDGEYYDSFEKSPRELVTEGKVQVKTQKLQEKRDRWVAKKKRQVEKLKQQKEVVALKSDVRNLRRQSRKLALEPVQHGVKRLKKAYEISQGWLDSSRYLHGGEFGEEVMPSEPPIKIGKKPPEHTDKLGKFFNFGGSNDSKFDWSLGKSSKSQRGESRAGNTVDLNTPSRGLFDLGSKSGSGSKFDFNVKSNMFSGVSLSAPIGGRRQRKPASQKKSKKRKKK